MAYSTKVYRVVVTMMIAVVMLAMVAVNPTGAASKFTDVSPRYTEAVNYLVENEITSGYTETEFGTDLKIKRVDASILLAKLLKLEISTDDVSGFTDVPKRGEPYIAALREAGVVSGKTATYFAAQDNITRGEMALILSKGFKLTGSGEELPFTDVSSRYTEAVDGLLTNKITFGKTDTIYGTADNLKRGEFALFLHRLSKLDDNGDNGDTVTKEDLQAIIDSVADLNEDDYTQDSWANLEDALTEANDTVADENATSEDIKNALDGLVDAINGLVEKTVDESVVRLDVLNDGLLDGSISIDDLLSNPELLRLKLLPGSGLVAGDVIKLGTDDFNLLTITLTEEDIARGYVELVLSTDLLVTLTGGQTLDLVAVVETADEVIEETLGSIKLPVYPIVEPVIDLAKNTVGDLSSILAGEKDLRIDITAEGLAQVKVNDVLKLKIDAGDNTKTVQKVITQEDITRGYVLYTFSDSNLIKNLLEGLTTGSEIEITPEVVSGTSSTVGASVTYVLTEGIIESLVDLLGDLLGGVLDGLLGGLGGLFSK